MHELFEELRTALYSVWHRRWIALAVAWGVCLLGWLVVALIPNSYESKARIYVDVEDVLSEQLGIAGDGKEEIARVRQTLLSSVNLEKVITTTKLGDGISDRQALERSIASLSKDVEIQSEEDNLFSITASVGKGDLSDAENAVLARDVVQKLLDIFREEHIAGNRAEISGAINDLNEQLEERKVELEEAEARRVAFEAQYPDLVGGTQTLSTRVQQSRTELRDIDADLAAAQSALAALNNQIASTPRTLVGSADAVGPQAALLQAQTQLAGLRSRGLTEEHPDVVSTKRQVELLTRQVAASGPNEVSGTPNPAYSSLVALRADRQASIESLQSRRAALQSQMASLAASQATEPAVAAEANRISRDYEVLRDNYEKLLEDREKLRTRGDVVDETSQYKFDLVDPPVVPQKPAAPNRPLLLLGVLIAGIGAGIGVAWIMGQLRSGYATAGKLEKSVGLPVIGSVSLNLSEAAQSLRKRRLRQFAGACAALVGVLCVLLVIEVVSIGTIA
ncbi:chain-length determining protein [Erythrobacter sp. SCSIO 43205]|uniref:XrtA system polysaccharide chain length determinant n=1 Tax=Erythrobacter sp. SCSIO 43205 TaxID=2779361 RepID=UPI001CA8F856|nr:XrtA system polysaccharide chain length determinant [Erythrobacter sp. SCSIO 43205]UAB77273.1 chain-length determining protein [Erythrobacter sp. SCSIO 43205]